MTTLLDEIHAKCTPEQIAEGNYHVIADLVNVGRTKYNGMEIGNGTVLKVLGLTDGNKLLDALYASATFKYVIPLMEQGRMVIDSDALVADMQALVDAGAVTQPNLDKLLAVMKSPDPVTWEQCQAAVLGA